MDKIHIGNMIRCQLKEQGRSMTWFANAIHSDRSNAYKMLNRSQSFNEHFRIAEL